MYSFCTLVKSEFHVDVITEGSNYASVFGVPPLFYILPLNSPCKRGVILLSLLYVPIMCSACSTALWRGLSWCKLMVVIMSLLEKVHVIFLYLLFLLASSPSVGTYLLSKNSWFSLWRVIFCYWSQSTLKIWLSNFVVGVVVVAAAAATTIVIVVTFFVVFKLRFYLDFNYLKKVLRSWIYNVT